MFLSKSLPPRFLIAASKLPRLFLYKNTEKEEKRKKKNRHQKNFRNVLH